MLWGRIITTNLWTESCEALHGDDRRWVRNKGVLFYPSKAILNESVNKIKLILMQSRLVGDIIIISSWRMSGGGGVMFPHVAVVTAEMKGWVWNENQNFVKEDWCWSALLARNPKVASPNSSLKEKIEEERC